MEKERKGPWAIRNLLTSRGPTLFERNGDEEKEWSSVSMGMAFAGEKNAWIAEGNTGRVRLVDLATGGSRRIISINQEL